MINILARNKTIRFKTKSIKLIQTKQADFSPNLLNQIDNNINKQYLSLQSVVFYFITNQS